MRALPTLATLLACSLLAACAGPSTQPADPARQAFADAGSFCTATMADPRLDALRRHTAVSPSAPTTLEMLSDTTRVSADERAAVALWSGKTSDCQDRMFQAYRQHAPALVTANWDAMFAATVPLRTALYAGDISWGEFNRARQRLTTGAQRAANEITLALRRNDLAEAQAVHDAAIADRASFIQAHRMAMLRLQPLSSAR